MRKLILPAAIIAAVALIDQLTKIWAFDALSGGRSIEIFGRFFMFTLVFNEGGAMGTNIGSPIIYLVLALIILPVLCYYIYQHREHRVVALPLSFIAGGAIGNLIDRFRLGKVVDFLDVDFPDVNIFGYHLSRWWTFNVADAAISCGILFLVFYLWRSPKGKVENASIGEAGGNPEVAD